MRICFLLIISALVSLTAVAQTSPPASTTAPRPAGPVARTLTPAEERQRQKQAEWVEKERQFRIMWAAKERARMEKEAQRDREKAARKAEKEAAQTPGMVSTGADPSRRSTAPAVPPANPAAAPPDSRSPATAAPRDRDKTTQQTEAAAAEKARQDQLKTADRQRQQEADAAAKAARRAEREQQAQAEAAARAERRQAKKQPPSGGARFVPPATKPGFELKPVPAPTPAPAPASTPAPTRTKRPAVRPDAVALSADIQPDTLQSRMPVNEFLPKGHLFEPLVLDPLQAQASVSILPLFWTDGTKYPGTIVPFTFGFDKPFFRRYRDRNRADEWGLDAASFTQFEVYHDETDNVNRRRIINTDYRVSILYNLRRYNHAWRFRVYHLSSHLGDDYIFRNKITAPTPNSVNYEVIDATYSLQIRQLRVYAGLGIGLRQWQERKPLSAEIGLYYRRPLRPAVRMVAGLDAKFWQQTNFRPGIKAGWGIELGKPERYITFLIEAYTGFRPYSQYETQTVNWFGISTYLNPF